MSEIGAVLRRSWQSHFWTNLATTAILTLSFSLILSAILLISNLSRIFTVWGDEIQITVYLKDSIAPEEQANVKTTIQNQAGVESVVFVDKNGAAASFEKSLSSYGPNFLKAFKNDKDNPFPASFSVKLERSQKTPERIEQLATQFQGLPGVEDVSYGQEWLSNYSLLVKVSKMIATLFSVALLSACLFTVSNAIQASLFTRREEIEILELVGATSRTIRKPFLIEGAFQGFIAVLLSLGVMLAIYKVVYQGLEKLMGSSSLLPALDFLSPLTIIGSLMIGILIGALGSYLCVARLNTGWAAAEGVA